MAWSNALKDGKNKAALIVAVMVIGFFILYLPYFFTEIIDPKPGTQLSDPLLAILPPADYSWIIFGLIYSCIILTITTNYQKPEVILSGLVTYCAVSLLRMATMYVFTLEPPQGLIPLSDPFVALIAYEPTFAKDLFYSGHISTLAVLILIEPNAKLRTVKAIATLLVGVLLLIQHVHYTIDIVFAPIAAVSMNWLMIRVFSFRLQP